MSAPPELLATTEQLLASCLQQISPWDPLPGAPPPVCSGDSLPPRILAPASSPPSHWLGTRARAASDWWIIAQQLAAITRDLWCVLTRDDRLRCNV